jgi:lysophospholipase L1-like esterase/pimeloyl-ACP methyl ester carboxylesterase
MYATALMFVALTATVFAQSNSAPTQPIRVSCVGDSITAGSGASSVFQSYPSQLARMLGKGYDVENFGDSGTTLLKNGDKPYQKMTTFPAALASKPDIVIIMLGTNDTKPQNWRLKDHFAADYKDLIEQFKNLPAKPRIFIGLPPVIFGAGRYGITEGPLDEELPIINRVAQEEGCSTINIHAATEGKQALFPDSVHPNDDGAKLLADAVYTALTGKKFTGAVPSYLTSDWNGYERRDFLVDGRPCILVIPKTPLPGSPWIWRTEFFGAFAQADVALLGKGFYVAFMNSQDRYGDKVALDHFDRYYDYLTTQFHLSPKPVMEGFSRGGLYAFNWAARHPDRVSAIYGDAPVCDIKSWPGGKGKGEGAPVQWAQLLQIYGITEAQALAYKGNPIDNLAPLAAAKIPILGVYGDADKTVPPDENILVVAKRYKELGGHIELIPKPGVGHHPHSLTDPTPIVEFIVAHTASS